MPFMMAVTQPLTELYSEDLSFRSGLAFSICKCKGACSPGYECSQEGNLLSRENNIWSTKYPFKDPEEIFANYGGVIPHTVGFHAKIVRLFPSDGSTVHGKISYNLALIPYLQAKETIIYEEDGPDYKTYGTFYEYDEYLNLKKVYSLGYTNRDDPNSSDLIGNTFRKFYDLREIHNPVNPGFPLLNVRTINTNLQGAASYNETYPQDTVVTEIEYWHDYERVGYDDWSMSSSISGAPIPIPHNSIGKIPFGNYEFFGLTNLPHKTKVKDGYGRTLSQTDIFYDRNPASFQSCDLLGQNHDLANCWYDLNIPVNLETSFCTRPNPTYIRTVGELGEGYYERAYGTGDYGSDGISIPASEYNTQGAQYVGGDTVIAYATVSVVRNTFDHCGNVRETAVESRYKHPFFDEDPLNYGLEQLQLYEKTITTEYTGNALKPKNLTTSGPPDITVSATYYSERAIASVTNERGIVTEYDYDEIGRVIKVATPPDTLDSPTAEYNYSVEDNIEAGDVFGDEYIKIKEERKIDETRKITSYYFYDGMGRLIQSKTYDDAGTLGDISDDSVIISGRVYDTLGRVVREYRPLRVYAISSLEDDFPYLSPHFLVDGSHLDSSPNSASYLTYEYDSLGRLIITNDSVDNSFIKNIFRIIIGQGHDDYDVKEVTDPNENIRTYSSDSRGNLIKVQLPTP